MPRPFLEGEMVLAQSTLNSSFVRFPGDNNIRVRGIRMAQVHHLQRELRKIGGFLVLAVFADVVAFPRCR